MSLSAVILSIERLPGHSHGKFGSLNGTPTESVLFVECKKIVHQVISVRKSSLEETALQLRHVASI
jgi:hypothetical protein